jgi:hypothetical protein
MENFAILFQFLQRKKLHGGRGGVEDAASACPGRGRLLLLLLPPPPLPLPLLLRSPLAPVCFPTERQRFVTIFHPSSSAALYSLSHFPSCSDNLLMFFPCLALQNPLPFEGGAGDGIVVEESNSDPTQKIFRSSCHMRRKSPVLSLKRGFVVPGSCDSRKAASGRRGFRKRCALSTALRCA